MILAVPEEEGEIYVQRNLTIILNFLFSLSWVYFASQVSSSLHIAAYYKLVSFGIVAVFMLTLLAVLLQRRKFLKYMLFANRLFAIFLGIKLGLNIISAPTVTAIMFLVFVVLPFVINILMLGKLQMIEKTDDTDGEA